MIEFARYRPVAVVVVGVLAVLASIHFFLSMLVGPTPVWCKETCDLGPRDAGKEVASAVQTMRQDKMTIPLNLILGQSTAITDLDPAVLEKESRRPNHWLIVNSLGSSFLKFASGMEPLWNSGLKPHLCLLMIDPVYLAGQPSVTTTPDHRRVVDLGAQRSTSIWLLANQRYINTDVQLGCLTARKHFITALRQPIDVMFEPADVNLLYHDLLTTYAVGSVSPLIFKDQLEKFSGYGAFSSFTYNVDSEQAIALLQVIRGCRRLGAQIVVAIQPSSILLRSRLPANAERCLESILARAQQEGPLTVFDMRATQPEDHIHDCTHLNQAGRRSNTLDVAYRMKRVFGPDFGGL